MSDQEQQGQQPGGQETEGERKRRLSVGEGIRSGIGVLTAFKEAVEETIQEAVQRGDLKPERAKQFVTDAVSRAGDAVGGVRERLDFVPHKTFDELKAEVEALRARVEALEARGGGSSASTAPPASLPPSGPPAPEGPTEARMP